MIPLNPYFKPPSPVRCCHSCGAEFHDGGHIQAKQAGWRGFSRPIEVKQANGTYRMEHIGECPACVSDNALTQLAGQAQELDMGY